MFHSFHNCCQSFLFSHRHRLGLKRQMKKNAKMQDICNKETKTTAASLGHLDTCDISVNVYLKRMPLSHKINSTCRLPSSTLV